MSTDDRQDLLGRMNNEERDDLSQDLSGTERNEWTYQWPAWARPAQLPPPGDWRVWLIMAGRGFGKTRAGSEWVTEIALKDPAARIALIGASLGEVRKIMVEGESGILSRSPFWREADYEPSLRRLRFPNDAEAMLYSAAEPESLRGPQHSHAWCDEVGKWNNAHERAMRSWDNLLLGLRLGKDQRVLATTTPRSVPLVRRLIDGADQGDTVITKGSTLENAGNLATGFVATMRREFGESLLARQELDGELIEDIDGALWSRSLLEDCRQESSGVEHARVVVGVDPPASASGDACGILVAALGLDGTARVLADASVEKATPERWARAVSDAARAWSADRVVAEANQGGAMVESVLRAADIALPVKLVHARRGKSARAEPVAALYEAGRVKHVGMFAKLEDQLCGMMAGGGYEGPGRSPDRADALVWALTELMLGRRQVARIRRF